MRVMKKGFTLLLMLVMTISVMSISAFAYDEAALNDFINTGGGISNRTISRMLTSDSAKASTDPDLQGVTFTDQSTNTVYYVKDGYNKSAFYTQVEMVKKNAKVSNDMTEMTNGLGVEADTQTAVGTLEGFIPIINILLGLLTVCITLGLAVFTSFDVCYIVFPVFRNKCDDAKVSGQGPMVAKTANGGTKLRWVSDEAQYVVEQCNVSQGGNPLMAYLKKRIVAYILVSVILFILLTGNITIITNIALKVVSYIMDILASLG